MNHLQTYLYALFVSGFLCSLLLFLHGNASTKTGLETGCACIMLIVFLSPLVSNSPKETFASLTSTVLSEETKSNIQTSAIHYAKQVMEQEYRAYILSRAEEFGVTLSSVSIELEETNDGHWIPYLICYRTDNPLSETFMIQMEASLGVPLERQKIYETTVIT